MTDFIGFLNDFKALESIDYCGKMTNIRYSQVNPHRTFKEAKQLELCEAIDREDTHQKQIDEEKTIS